MEIIQDNEFLKPEIKKKFFLNKKNSCKTLAIVIVFKTEVRKSVFFEPDNSRDVHKRVTESLISDSFVYTSNMENTRVLLGKETEKQGLRGADLAELTGWSPSKTSKLTAGKQKLTAEDTRIWARALGIHQIRL